MATKKKAKKKVAKKTTKKVAKKKTTKKVAKKKVAKKKKQFEIRFIFLKNPRLGEDFF